MCWACAQLEPRREASALHFLKLNGYETYNPRLREVRRVGGRKITVMPSLFPGYCFVLIVAGHWWTARWSPGVVRLIMRGIEPAHVSDNIISDIRSRERAGLIELPKRLAPGARVRVISGPLHESIGMLAALRPHERVLALLHLLGSEAKVELARSAVEAV
jgi:transcriptional antiterminator RfaH